MKVFLLVAGILAACGLAGLFSILLAVALSAGRGAGGAGSVMMTLLLLLALVYLGSLVPLIVLARRWTASTGLAVALGVGSGVLLALLWAVVAFVMAVILNR